MRDAATAPPDAAARRAGGSALRRQARAAFLTLPPSVQRQLLHALGRYAPWEPEFPRTAPTVAGDLLVSPPDFVGVGVQKAGTSWWYELIAAHPGVYHQEGFHKERHFFKDLALSELSALDAGEYHLWFPRPEGLVTGEWTPDYLHQHWVAPMLRSAAPGARLLVLLRDPVERYRSGLDHHRQRGEKLTPQVVADAFARGLYGAELSRLESVFPRSQLLVLQYEACVESPRRLLAETYSFLGLDDSFVPADLSRRVSATTIAPIQLPQEVRRHLAELYRDDLRLLGELHPEIDLDRWPASLPRAGNATRP